MYYKYRKCVLRVVPPFVTSWAYYKSQTMHKPHLFTFYFFVLSLFSGFATEIDKTTFLNVLANEQDAAKVETAMLDFFKTNMATTDLAEIYQHIDHLSSEDNKVHLLSWPSAAKAKDENKIIVLQSNDGKAITACRVLDLELGIEEFLPAVPSGIFSFDLIEGPHYMLQFSGELSEEESQYHVLQLYEADGFVLCKSCMAHEAELIIEKPLGLDLNIQVISRIGRIMYQDYEWHKRKKIYQETDKIQYKLVNNVFLKTN